MSLCASCWISALNVWYGKLENLYTYCSDSLANLPKEPMVSELKAFPQSGGAADVWQKSLDDM